MEHRKKLIVEFASNRMARKLVQYANPDDPVDGTRRLARTLHSIIPAPAGTIGVVLMMCSTGIAIILRYQNVRFVSTWKSSAKRAVRILHYAVPEKSDVARYLYERVNTLHAMFRVSGLNKRQNRLCQSVPVLTKHALHALQGWCAVFEKKIIQCNGPTDLRFRIVDRMVDRAFCVAVGELSEEEALLSLVRLNHRLKAA